MTDPDLDAARRQLAADAVQQALRELDRYGRRLSRGVWRAAKASVTVEIRTVDALSADDERFIAEQFWLMADHENRIPQPGDYFVSLAFL